MLIDIRIKKVLTIITLDFLGYMILFPIIPFKISQLGGTPLTYGVLLTIYAICQLISAPLLGALSDSIGRRIPLLISLSGTFLAFIIIYFSTSIEVIIAAIILDGLTSGNIPLPQAMLSDFTRHENRTRIYAISGTWISICVLVGPLITAITNKINPSIPLLAAIGIIFLNILFVFFFIHNPQLSMKSVTLSTIGSGSKQSNWTEKIKAVSALKILFLIYVLFLYVTIHFNTGFALFVKNHIDFFGNRIGTTEYSYLLSYAACFSILTQYLLLPILLKIFSEMQLVISGFFLNLFAYTCFFFSSKGYILFIALPLIATSVALIKPCLTSTVSKQDKILKLGSLMGAFQSLSSIVLILVPLLSGKLLKAELYSIWLLIPVLTGITAVFVSYFNIRTQKIHDAR